MWCWYVLVLAGYLSLGILVAKLTSPRGLQVFQVVSLCVTILVVPFQRAPYNYVTAVLAAVVVVLLIGPSRARVSGTGPSRHRGSGVINDDRCAD